MSADMESLQLTNKVRIELKEARFLLTDKKLMPVDAAILKAELTELRELVEGCTVSSPS